MVARRPCRPPSRDPWRVQGSASTDLCALPPALSQLWKDNDDFSGSVDLTVPPHGLNELSFLATG